MKNINGSCSCGGLKYNIVGELVDVAFCHCSICRRTLGAAFGTYARVKSDNFSWLSEENLIEKYESSPNVYRCFCRKCGSPMGGLLGKDEKLSWVTLGTVTGDSGVRPLAHIFVGSKAPWYEITDDLPQFEEWPTKSSELFERFY